MLGTQARGGEAGDLAAVRGGVGFLDGEAGAEQDAPAQAMASLEIPVWGGRSRSRVPSARSTRSRLAPTAREVADSAS